MSSAVQAVRVAMVTELAAETERHRAWIAGSEIIAGHYSQGRIDGIAWALAVLGYLEPAALGD